MTEQKPKRGRRGAVPEKTDLTRVTVNLVPKSDAAMHRIMKRDGISLTDAINAALPGAANILKHVRRDGSLHIPVSEGLTEVIYTGLIPLYTPNQERRET